MLAETHRFLRLVQLRSLTDLRRQTTDIRPQTQDTKAYIITPRRLIPESEVSNACKEIGITDTSTFYDIILDHLTSTNKEIQQAEQCCIKLEKIFGEFERSDDWRVLITNSGYMVNPHILEIFKKIGIQAITAYINVKYGYSREYYEELIAAAKEYLPNEVWDHIKTESRAKKIWTELINQSR